MLYFGICLSLHLGFRKRENWLRLADNSGEILGTPDQEAISGLVWIDVIGDC